MRYFAYLGIFTIIFTPLLISADGGCAPSEPTSRSGVSQATLNPGLIKTDSKGRTIEQRNILKRYKADNNPGSIKYLYIISAFSGDVLVFSPVDGKVTSSKKRLTPTTVNSFGTNHNLVDINGKWLSTTEVLQDDGTYGSSIEYLYWFDTRGIYHQHFVSGGQIIHVSDQPLRVGRVIIDMSIAKEEE